MLQRIEMTKIYLLGVFILLLLPAEIIGQEYYASWAPLSENAPLEVKNQMQTNYLNTPTQDEFEIPAYPNSFIISLTGIGDNPADSTRLPVVTLISIDSPSKIIEYYQDKIKKNTDWKWDKSFKMFYKGNPMKALNRHAPYIMIQSAAPDEFDLVNILKTLRENVASKISVCFNPNTIK